MDETEDASLMEKSNLFPVPAKGNQIKLVAFLGSKPTGERHELNFPCSLSFAGQWKKLERNKTKSSDFIIFISTGKKLCNCRKTPFFNQFLI